MKKENGLSALFSVRNEDLRYAFQTKNLPTVDLPFAILVLILTGIGTATVFSAGVAYADFRYEDAYFFIKRQILWVVIGLGVLYLSACINPKALFSLSGILYLSTIVLLVLVLVFGFVGNGAKRWISIGPITIQPSEICKFTMVLMLGRYFSVFEHRALEKRDRKTEFFFGTVFPCLLFGIPILLVMLQKHLSCIIILGLIGICVTLSAGVGLRYLAGFSAVGAMGITALALFTDYTKDRINVWLNPERYRLSGGWQTLQGLMAIGSGGLFGRGIGKSILKYCYISEPANDMIFTVFCEECGLFGAVCVLVLFALLSLRGFQIALKAPTVFERLTVIGIISKVSIQALLNVAVVTNTIPNTGISLPFFSYGGSSLIMLLFEMGYVLSVSRRAKILAY